MHTFYDLKKHDKKDHFFQNLKKDLFFKFAFQNGWCLQKPYSGTVNL